MNSDILYRSAKLNFEILTDNEIRILQAVANGDEAVAKGPSSVRAELLEWLCTDLSAIAAVHRHGLALRGQHVTGLLDLVHANITFPLQMHHCSFDSDIWLKSSRLRSLSLRGSKLKGLNADSAVIDTNVLLCDGCETYGEVAFRGAVIKGDLRADGAKFVACQSIALICDRASISGGIFLSQKTTSSHYKGEVRFAGASVVGNFDCEGAIFDNADGTALNTERLKTLGGMFLRGSHCTGIVNLSGSKVEVVLDCRGTIIVSDDGMAFNAEKTSVGSYALLDNGFSCDNTHLLGLSVGGALRCRASRIGKLDLRYARIGGLFEWLDMVTPEHSLLDLRDAVLGSIEDQAQSWPKRGRLRLDGLTFERFSDSVTNVASRLTWLELDETNPIQPYRQLSRVYQANGHVEDAGRVLLALEKRIRANQRSVESRIWNTLLLVTIGYGYQLWRAAILMLLLIVCGTGISALAYRTKLVAPTDKDANSLFVRSDRVPTQYPRFSSTIFSMEHSLPGLNLGVAAAWSADTTANWPEHMWIGPVIRFWFWLQSLLGWLLSFFFIAGISGVVKTSK